MSPIYAVVAILAFSVLLVAGLDHPIARIVAVALLVLASVCLGMLLQANTPEDDR